MYAPKVLKSQTGVAHVRTGYHRAASETDRQTHCRSEDDIERTAVDVGSWDFGTIPLTSGTRPDLASRPSPAGPRPGVIQAKLAVGEVNDPLEREAEQAAEQVLALPEPSVPVAGAVPHLSRVASSQSTSAGTEAVAAANESGEIPLGPMLSTAPVRLQGQWSDAPPGPAGGARSSTAAAPSSGWNRGEVSVGTIRRIPVEGLQLGNQISDRPREKVPPHRLITGEDTRGRAIALIPEGIDLAQPVEVLLHLHGFNIGYRQRKIRGLDPSLKPGTVRDVDTDQIEQQLQASGRPMIGVLPQGTSLSGFGNLNADAYIAEVFRALSRAGAFGGRPAPKVARVVLSGHSGAGGPIRDMIKEPGQPRLPSSLGEVALFDAINGEDQLARIQAWVLSHLSRDLSALTAQGISAADQQVYLQTSLRFRAYYTESSYRDVHLRLKAAIASWFTVHTRELGGTSSALYNVLQNNYRVLPVGHGHHEVIMSRGAKLLDALRVLPPALPPAVAPPVQPKSVQRGSDHSRPIDNTALARVGTVLGSPGAPLDVSTQTFFRPRFQHDFSEVRVHTSQQAGASTRGINAEAYTVGRHIVFAPNAYDPASSKGRRLLAHELAHVVQQTGVASRADTRVQRQAMPVAEPQSLSPIRANEANKSLVSFNSGPFSIFVPDTVITGSRGAGVDNLKVHVFFVAGSVQGPERNDIIIHGLRGASEHSDWVTIGVPAYKTISDKEITDCLASIGITSPIKTIRLTGHSRGGFTLMNSITEKKLTRLSLIERVTLLDADDNPDKDDPDRVTKTPKVEVLTKHGIDPHKIVAYEVNVHKRHVGGATYIGLDSGSMAAIGYVRVIQDALITNPKVAALVPPGGPIRRQLDTLPLPPRGTFTTGAPRPGQTSLQAFSQKHQAEIQAILAHDTSRTGLLTFINVNDLLTEAGYKFDRGVSAHHFFVAEIAQELTN